MFRFYELYSLYLKKMSSSCSGNATASNSNSASPGWCLCEKLPRSILHIAPTPEVWCEVCGRRRRPRACLSSSSDEEERAAERRQQLIAERRRNNADEEAEVRRGLVRVKVAMSAKKPKPRRKSHCNKCMVGMVCAQQLKPNTNNSNNHGNNNNNNNNSSNTCKSRTYTGRFGCYRKPQRLVKRRPVQTLLEAEVDADAEGDVEPTAPPPPPTPSPPAGESLWEQPAEDMPNLVAFAHEVFNRPLHLRQRQSTFYDNLFVSDFIPLDKPITDSAGGAISKRHRNFGRPLRSHCSQPLPPLSQVLSEILAKQKVRAKGGGLPPKPAETQWTASQFSPFDCYEGPSEDALVVDSARQMLRQPKALHIGERKDLPNTRLSSFESEPSSDCSSSSPFDVPTAPPAEHPRHGYSVGGGAPLRLHDMMKAVAQSGLSDSSASSSSTDSSSSHKSANSTPVRSRGGEEPPYVVEEKPVVEPNISHLSIMEKILWLMEQKPTGEPHAVAAAAERPIISEPSANPSESAHTDPVKGLLQFMESLQIDSKLLKGNLEADNNCSPATGSAAGVAPPPSAAAPAAPPDIDTRHHVHSPTNDMSNELHLNSTNKSAGDAKYHNGLSGTAGGTSSGGGGSSSSSTTTGTGTGNATSMWSLIRGFFGSATKTRGEEELQPLRRAQKSQYGATDNHITRYEHDKPRRRSSSQNINKEHSKPAMKPKNLAASKQIKDKKKQEMPEFSKYKLDSTKQHSSISNECSEPSNEFSLAKPKEEFQHDLSNEIANRPQEVPNSREKSLRNSKKTRDARRSKKVEIKTSFQVFESVFDSETYSHLQPGSVRRNLQLQELLRQLKSMQPNPPKAMHMAKIFGLVQYECSEIIRPKMVSYCGSGELRVGRLRKYLLKPINTMRSLALLEFRTPDIQQTESNDTKILENINETLKESVTSETNIESCSQVQTTQVPDMQRFPAKRKPHPVWPAQPFRHRKRHVKYQATHMELTYSISEDIAIETANSENFHSAQSIHRKKRSTRWIGNQLVQQKIDEMMAKPIQLLS
ncbi:hypothetical protein KR222_005121 [Zaprionus bogoriensis]|nr:hypothetical protein KR222_005121 [Zaprionus bogoriensis]